MTVTSSSRVVVEQEPSPASSSIGITAADGKALSTKRTNCILGLPPLCRDLAVWGTPRLALTLQLPSRWTRDRRGRRALISVRIKPLLGCLPKKGVLPG